MSTIDLLPPELKLLEVARGLGHHPTTTRYRSFRSCLRWDFGFTCAFCCLHESDLVDGGVEGIRAALAHKSSGVIRLDPQVRASGKILTRWGLRLNVTLLTEDAS